MERFVLYVKAVSNILFSISLFLLAALMFLTAADVTGRSFGNPIRGAYQISEILQVAVICLAWPLTTSAMGHVRLDLLVSRFSPWLQNKIDFLTTFLSLLVFVIITWQGVVLARRTIELGDLIAIIDIPLYPFVFVIPVGAFLNCLVLLIQLRNLLKEARGGCAQ